MLSRLLAYTLNMQDLKDALYVMGVGMVGIFAVILLIYLIVFLLGKWFPDNK